MGGGGPQVANGSQIGNSQSSLIMNPQYSSALSGGANQFQNQTADFQKNANAAAGSVAAPTLNTNFAGPNFSPQLDQFSQNLVSQGQGNLASQTASQQANIANQFRGNSGASQVLQSQAAMQGNLAQNPLLFQAGQQQQARQAQNFELNQGAQTASNNAALQQATAKQQSAANGLQFQNAGLDSQQNLLSILSSLGTLTGTANSNSSSLQGPFLSALNGAVSPQTVLAMLQNSNAGTLGI